jgi:ABC-type sugar transport system substrate-binding protein
MNTKHVIAAATALAAAVALAGCSASTAGSGSGSDSAGGKTTVCYITAADSHAYATPANEALQAAADEAGVEVLKLSQDFDAQNGTDQLNTCIGRGVQGIVLWPVDPQAYIPGLVKAQDAGIPVVLINSPMDDEALKLVASFTGPDTVEEGELSAEAVEEALGGEGNVVILAGQAGNGTTIGRTDGFNAKLKELGSKIKVLDTVNADFDQQKALVASRDLITRFGDDIDAVYANDDTMARGFIDAWIEAGKTEFPVIVGINGQADAFQSIKDGQMHATILQSPVEDGKLALETIVKVIEGEKVDARLPIPLTVVNKDNVDSLEPAL